MELNEDVANGDQKLLPLFLVNWIGGEAHIWPNSSKWEVYTHKVIHMSTPTLPRVLLQAKTWPKKPENSMLL